MFDVVYLYISGVNPEKIDKIDMLRIKIEEYCYSHSNVSLIHLSTLHLIHLLLHVHDCSGIYHYSY